MPGTLPYVVTATSLNLRSQPVVAEGNVIAALPKGQIVRRTATPPSGKWWEVTADLKGKALRGYASSDYLSPSLPAPDLKPSSPSRRNLTTTRAFPLNEPDMPRRAGASPKALAASLATIIDYLAVDSSARYQKRGRTTFCNIYSYDYCCLAGAYLPRVWWTDEALRRIEDGESVDVAYGATVQEMTANALHAWLKEFGPVFGWSPVSALTALQDAANAGKVCLITGRRVRLGDPGHICPVVPETPDHHAKRGETGVTAPLQSQAGASNFRYGAGVWWTDPAKFAAHGFWAHP